MSRARPVLLRRVVPLAAVLAIAGATAASAIPPGGAVDNPQGAVATVTPSPAAPGTVISFTGTGFTEGETVTVKIDDGAILKPGGSDQFAVVTGQAGGTISGTVDLSQAAPASPVAAGDHWLRFLSSKPRSLKAAFTVQVPATNPGGSTPETTPGGTTTPTTPTPTTPVAPKGPVWLTATVVKPTKTKKKLALKLQAGAFGSAGTVSVRTKTAYKIGKAKKKTVVVTKSAPYFLDKLGSDTVNVSLTADGQALLKKKTSLVAIVTLKDANGEDTVKTEVTIKR